MASALSATLGALGALACMIIAGFATWHTMTRYLGYTRRGLTRDERAWLDAYQETRRTERTRPPGLDGQVLAAAPDGRRWVDAPPLAAFLEPSILGPFTERRMRAVMRTLDDVRADEELLALLQDEGVELTLDMLLTT